MSREETYLRAILATVARQTFPVQTILDVVARGPAWERQVQAYNLCDGTRSQAEVGKQAGLDQGAFSRTLSRWIDTGIVIRVGEGKSTVLLHVYPLPESAAKRGKANED